LGVGTPEREDVTERMLDWIENDLADSARYPRLDDGAPTPFRVVMPHIAQVGSADDCRPDISMV
jgi:hypothetical protein